MLAAPAGSKTLEEIDAYTKYGHGLYTIDGADTALGSLVVGVISSGFSRHGCCRSSAAPQSLRSSGDYQADILGSGPVSGHVRGVALRLLSCATAQASWPRVQEGDLDQMRVLIEAFLATVVRLRRGPPASGNIAELAAFLDVSGAMLKFNLPSELRNE
jgi:hypothetical protein